MVTTKRRVLRSGRVTYRAVVKRRYYKDLLLGEYATREEARAAVEDWWSRRRVTA